MRAEIRRIVNQLNSRSTLDDLEQLVKFTPEEMRELAVAIQNNPLCMGQLLNNRRDLLNGLKDSKMLNSDQLNVHLTNQLGTAMQFGVIIGFLLATRES